MRTLKQQAAEAALQYISAYLTPQMILGVGTGSTVNYFIESLGALKEEFKGAVSSSQASSRQLQQQGIALFNLDQVDCLPFYIDGADELTPEGYLIKGGGGALTCEKIIAAAAQQFICIADESKYMHTLGTFPLPIELLQFSYQKTTQNVMACLEKMCTGSKEKYRAHVRHLPHEQRPQHANGIESIYCTEHGHFIIDIAGLTIEQPAIIESALNQIPGVVTVGLFALRAADTGILATASGVVIKNFKDQPI